MRPRISGGRVVREVAEAAEVAFRLLRVEGMVREFAAPSGVDEKKARIGILKN